MSNKCAWCDVAIPEGDFCCDSCWRKIKKGAKGTCMFCLALAVTIITAGKIRPFK